MAPFLMRHEVELKHTMINTLISVSFALQAEYYGCKLGDGELCATFISTL